MGHPRNRESVLGPRGAWLAKLCASEPFDRNGVLVRDIRDPHSGRWIKAAEDRAKAWPEFKGASDTSGAARERKARRGA